MTPERWHRIEGLVEAALKHDRDDRSRFLAAECGSDDELRRHAAALLDSYGQVDTFMEAPAALDLAAAAREGGARERPASALPGALESQEMIGPYRLLDEIGHGGMGSVFLAARGDGEYRQRVAIKLIRHGIGSRSLARRFRNERQILAHLVHPHIARLLDGGTTSDGRPYFVMELIEGTRIDDYCDRRRSTIPQRLELFEQACTAVAYAHRNLVVHRDLKPGNILVTDEGTPKLLDFGIAKLLDPSEASHTVEATHSGLAPMTPPYASPEQILGQPITTASDVYSLGVLLYYLLTGRLPFERTPLMPRAAIYEDLARELPRPSAAVATPVDGARDDDEYSIAGRRRLSIPQLCRRLSGDLDNIVSKALRREPERRYGSVEALAADLRRHLEGLPVQARRPSLRYRAGKFLRRHRLGVAAGGVILVLGIGSAVQITHQRDLAEQQRDRAERVSDTLIDLFENLDPNQTPRSSLTARQILDRGVEDVALELRDQPQTLAAVQIAIGKVYRNLGLYDHAQPLLENALEIRRNLLGEEHLDVAAGQYELAMLYSLQRDPRDAALHQRALEIRRELLGPDHMTVAESLLGIGDARLNRLKPNQALPYFKQALDIAERHLGPDHVETARISSNVAIAYWVNREPAKALPGLQRSIRILGSTLGPEHPRLVNLLISASRVHCEIGNYAAGEDHGQRALDIQEKHLGSKHPDISSTLDYLAYCQSSQGNFQRAEELLSRATDINREVFGAESRSVSTLLHNLAIIHLRQEEYDEAAELVKKSLDIMEAVDPRHPQLAMSLSILGTVSNRRGDPELAAASFQRSLSISEELIRRDSEDQLAILTKARSLTGLGEVHDQQGRHQQAANDYSAALSSVESFNSSVPELLLIRAQALTYLGRAEEARPIVDELHQRGWKNPDFLKLSREYGYGQEARQ